jgi:hypothetical protein
MNEITLVQLAAGRGSSCELGALGPVPQTSLETDAIRDPCRSQEVDRLPAAEGVRILPPTLPVMWVRYGLANVDDRQATE